VAAKNTGSRPKSSRSWAIVEPDVLDGNQGLALDLPPVVTREVSVPASGVVRTVESSDSIPPMTVSQLSSRIRGMLEGHFDRILVTGEITGFRPAGSGHIYFALKDSGALINCVLWARDATRQQTLPRDGEEAEIEGRIGVYEPRGQYQLVVTTIRPAGVGKLHAEFLRLKATLEKAGLFDSARKRPIPRTPATVGVVTSPTGAALRDILSVLGRRAPGIRVLIWPARVQGDGAAREVTDGIQYLSDHSCCDVIIVGRGGGSMEDLWAFNDEKLARAIAQSAIPVISAVGHEVDFTIADFVADLRAATPSAAAEIVSQSSAELARELGHLRTRLDRALQARMEALRRVTLLQSRLGPALSNRLRLLRVRLDQVMSRPVMARPADRLERERQKLDEFQYRSRQSLIRNFDRIQRRFQTAQATLNAHGQGITQRIRSRIQQFQTGLDRHLSRHLEQTRNRLHSLQSQLRALDPTAILSRGYAVVHLPDGGAVRNPDQAAPGTQLTIRVADGSFPAVSGTSTLPTHPIQSALPQSRVRKSAKTRDQLSPAPSDLFDGEEDTGSNHP
jgi:exodeoxyribonuclease VII large subunit